jgi:phage FluMu gp28-like protein
VARSLRSKQGRVIIDEAAFVDDLDELKKAAMALLMWGGCVRILSTHNGDDNPFNELVKEIRDGKWEYSLHRTTTRWNKAYTGASALSKKKNGRKPVRMRGARKLPTATVTEELFCIPVRAGTRYFPSSLIESVLDGSAAVARKTCEDGFTFEKEERRIKEFKAWLESEVRDILKTHTGPVYIGEDFARSGDLTCILSQFRLALDELQPDGKPFLAIELRNVPFAQQWQTILYLMDTLPNFSGGAFDGRGNGQMIAELRNGPAMWSR